MRVLEYLRKEIKRNPIHLTLIDPDKQTSKRASKIAKEAAEGGTKGFMIGGSRGISEEYLDTTVREIKGVTDLPIILFPGDISGISPNADAIFFMSLLNSRNPYFITGAQAMGAPIIRKIGIEPIPMGYIIVEPGGAVGKVGAADLISRSDHERACGYALAAQYFGMQLVYLEAGSGADEHVPEKMITEVKKVIDIPLIVGGGIKTEEDAYNVAKSGADIVVTGTVVERTSDVKGCIKRITSSLRKIHH
jgi:phosphoglycerol geranylgeranyltransferase